MPFLSQRFSHRFEADLAAEFLSEAGIDAWVCASDAGGNIPSLQVVDGVRLEVSDENVQRAEGLVRDWRATDESETPRLSARERLQSWLVGGLLILILGWVLGSVVWNAANRTTPTEHREVPGQGQTPW